jgi:23S rRNA (pseudouridine1915-N3)-methyltransferase
MRVTIAAVGRLGPGPERDLYERYAARCTPPLLLREVTLGASGAPAKRRAAETALLLAAIPKGARTVALDERGRDLTSNELAALLGRWRDDGAGDVGVLIGGADGLDGPARDRCDLVLRLGALTWPHLMVRALIAEQLYRAQTILAGHPYHRE